MHHENPLAKRRVRSERVRLGRRPLPLPPPVPSFPAVTKTCMTS